MPSSKERLRWERWYDQVSARMDRQKASLDRTVLIITETVAALEEIAAGGATVGADGDAAYAWAKERAQACLDQIKDPAAATVRDVRESMESEEPIDDPRRKH